MIPGLFRTAPPSASSIFASLSSTSIHRHVEPIARRHLHQRGEGDEGFQAARHQCAASLWRHRQGCKRHVHEGMSACPIRCSRRADTLDRTSPSQVWPMLCFLTLYVGTKLEVKTKTPNGVQFTVKGNQDPKIGMSIFDDDLLTPRGDFRRARRQIH